MFVGLDVEVVCCEVFEIVWCVVWELVDCEYVMLFLYWEFGCFWVSVLDMEEDFFGY